MAENLRKVYLVDGSGYIFRAYYAIQHLSNKEGFPTNALFGFMRMLLKLLSQADSPYVAVVFDAGRKTFRNDLYAEYKANRTAAPDDLVKQMPYFREFVRALGLPVLELPGFEADDIIATLAKRVTEQGTETIVVSGDKDLMQLVGSGVTMWDTMRDKRYGPAEVEEKFGVPPEKVVEVLGLMGDQSDNVPGLPGVGPKTAAQLIQRYGSVEGVLAAAGAIREEKSIRNRNKIAETVEAGSEMARLSRKLVEVDSNVPLGDCGIQDHDGANFAELLLRREIDHAALSDLISRFDFDSLLREFPDIRAPRVESAVDYAYRAVLEADFEAWSEEFLAQREFAFDVETTKLDPLEAELVGLSVCWSDDRAFYIPFRHVAAACLQPQIPFERFVERCGAHFADTSVRKIAQNSKFDVNVLAAQGVPVAGVTFDTMIASYVLNPDRSSHGLTSLAREYLGRTLIEYDGVVERGQTFADVPLAKATEYAGQDAHVTWLLAKHLSPMIDAEGVRKLFDEIEMPLMPVLATMERHGILLDMQLLAQLSDEFARQLAAMEEKIYELAKGPFNINSPKQLGEVLFGRLGIPTKGLKRTKSGVSTDSSVLEKLADEHPLPRLILDYRLIHKLKSTYVDTLPVQVSPRTGRLHTRLNQTVTGTGRLSSSDPNLQNIPISTPQGRRIREAFIADAAAGNVLVSADYSQIELRVLAHLSGDENLIRAFTEGADIHTATAREILNLPPGAEITSEQRRMGKTINFGIIYGMSGFRLGRELGIPVGVASEYIHGYFRRFPGVQQLFTSIEEEAARNGCVRTLFGRKRVVGSIDASDRDRGFLRRAALNAPIQGSAADIVKLAMIRLAATIERERAPLVMLLQIHDELLFECPRSFLEEGRSLIMGEMERVADLRVPLKVDVGFGAHWEEAHG